MATVKGTAKVDNFTVNESSVIVVTGKKSSTKKISKNGKNKIYGAAAKDTFTVKGGKLNYIYGDAGNDTITVTSKIGSGNRIYGDDANNKISGNDTFNINGGSKNYFYGGKGTDTFNVNGGSTNYIYGGEGNDKITLSGGKKNTIHGNAGNDTITVKAKAGTGNNIYGDAGNDKFYIEGGSHTVNGDVGTDTFTVKGGNNHTLRGGTGSDVYIVSSAMTSATKLSINQSDYTAKDTDTLQLKTVNRNEMAYTLSNGNLVIKHKSGGTITVSDWKKNPLNKIDFKDDTVTKAQITNMLNASSSTGTPGSTDTSGSVTVIRGLDGKSVLNGTTGNDLIYGDVATKSIYANDGNDEIIVGHNQIVYGGNGNDTITSTKPGTNVLYGGTGNDRIVVSGIGKNYLYGGDGADTLDLTPKGGQYYLYGGKGQDTYIANLTNLYSDTYTGGLIEIKNTEKAYTDEEYAALENAEANGYAVYKKINSDREDTLVINNYCLDDFKFELDKFDLVISRKYDVYATDATVDQSELIRIKDWYVHPLESIQFADGAYTADEINDYMASTYYQWVDGTKDYTTLGDKIRDVFLIKEIPNDFTISGVKKFDILDFNYFPRYLAYSGNNGCRLDCVRVEADLKIVIGKQNVITVEKFFENTNQDIQDIYINTNYTKKKLIDVYNANVNYRNGIKRWGASEKDMILYAGGGDNEIRSYIWDDTPKEIYGEDGDDIIEIESSSSSSGYDLGDIYLNGGNGNDTFVMTAYKSYINEGDFQYFNGAHRITIDERGKAKNEVDTLQIDYRKSTAFKFALDSSGDLIISEKSNATTHVDYRIVGGNVLDKIYFKLDDVTYTKEDIATMLNSTSVSSAMLTFSDSSVSSSANISNDLFQQNNSSNIIVTGNV